jgi:tetratricopeptide (TPR) repeat protein
MQQDSPGKIAICGLGGVGKTQIALELAYRMRNRDPECSILWISCTSYESVEQAYMSIALKLGITDPKPAEVKQQVKVYLSQGSTARWLLMFDNADDMEMWKTADFLPESERGHILLTTRTRQVAVRLASSHVIMISEPDTETAVEILRRSLITRDLLNDREAAIALLKELACLPLAIAQAAAYINEKDIRLSAYTTLLHESEPDVIELLSEDFGDEGRYKDIQNPVATTWWISFQQIQQLNPTAIDYLLFMACINHRHIPQSLLPRTTSSKKRTDAIGLLKAFSFVNEEGEACSLNIHRLVHLATRNWMRKNQLFSQQILKTADRLTEAFPNNYHTNRKLWREYLPHVLSLTEEAEFQKDEEKYVDMVQKTGNCLYSDGRSKEAEDQFLQVLKIRKQVLGPENPDTLTSMSDLAATYCSQGRWKESEELELQVMERRKQVLGPEHLDTLLSMTGLVAIYCNLGRWKEAEVLGVQVMEVRKQVLGLEHPDTLLSMANIATTYCSQGRWKESEELKLQVMERRKQVLGPEHPDTLRSMFSLATTYMKQRRRKEAEELNVEVTRIRKQVLGPEHPDTLLSMANLASMYWKSGRQKEAEELQVQVAEMQKKRIGPEHPHTLTSMGNLAFFWKSQGKTQAASALLKQCLALRKKVLGPGHPDTLLSSRALAEWTKEDRPLLDDHPLRPGQAASDHIPRRSQRLRRPLRHDEEHIERKKRHQN